MYLYLVKKTIDFENIILNLKSIFILKFVFFSFQDLSQFNVLLLEFQNGSVLKLKIKNTTVVYSIMFFL